MLVVGLVQSAPTMYGEGKVQPFIPHLHARSTDVVPRSANRDPGGVVENALSPHGTCTEIYRCSAGFCRQPARLVFTPFLIQKNTLQADNGQAQEEGQACLCTFWWGLTRALEMDLGAGLMGRQRTWARTACCLFAWMGMVDGGLGWTGYARGMIAEHDGSIGNPGGCEGIWRSCRKVEGMTAQGEKDEKDSHYSQLHFISSFTHHPYNPYNPSPSSSDPWSENPCRRHV